MPRGFNRRSVPARSRKGLRLLGVFALALAAPAAVAGSPGEDWPCVQQYVPELSLAQVWRGPDPARVGGHWAADPEIAPLVPRLAAPDRPLEEVEQEIRAFAAGLAGGDRERRLTLLFAGLFELLNGERRRAVEGALQFARNQRELAQRIRDESDRLFAGRRNGGDAAGLAELEERMNWDLRLFEDRRAATAAVCEQPDLIERRLFALARTISALLSEEAGG